MTVRSRLFPGLCLALLAGGCGSGVGGLSALPASPFATYRLAAGDEVRVIVPGLGAPDLGSASYVVNDRGELSLPIVGNIPVQGKTVPEAQTTVASALVRADILKAPTVSLQPVRLRPFYVLGEVKNPGEYPFRPGMSVLAAISVAGGYTFRADQKAVAIIRTADGQAVTGRANPGDMIQPGDTVRIYEKWF